MKPIKILILLLLITSCSSDNEDTCECTKTTYEIVQDVTIGSDGLPHLYFYNNILNETIVNCQNEVEQIPEGDLYFDITCN